MNDAFVEGDLCLLVDGRGRRYLIDLHRGSTFQYHAGVVRHEEIIGAPAGVDLRTSEAARLVALRPRLADYVLKMKRGAQVVYPKDLGPMVHWGDVAPGQTVVEAGTGSGALALALLRAVGPQGELVSVERRPDHLDHARAVITRFLGELPRNLQLVLGDVSDVVGEYRPHRVFLDLPEPWAVVAPAAAALHSAGLLCSYLPTVPQVQRLHEELRRSGRFTGMETFEVLQREWHLEGRSVRPESRMVGHTGFVTVAHLTQ